MYEKSFQTDFAAEALKGGPPVAVAASTAMGMVDWQTWVMVLTAIYVLMQIVWLGWKFVQKAQGKYRDENRDG